MTRLTERDQVALARVLEVIERERPDLHGFAAGYLKSFAWDLTALLGDATIASARRFYAPS